MKTAAALLAALAITGCASNHAPKIDSALVSIKIVDKPGENWPTGSAAVTFGSGTGVSRIEILRQHYPECLTHELRHVFEGKWHDQATTCR